jgi:hypothetical protein
MLAHMSWIFWSPLAIPSTSVLISVTEAVSEAVAASRDVALTKISPTSPPRTDVMRRKVLCM